MALANTVPSGLTCADRGPSRLVFISVKGLFITAPLGQQTLALGILGTLGVLGIRPTAIKNSPIGRPRRIKGPKMTWLAVGVRLLIHVSGQLSTDGVDRMHALGLCC